MQIVCVSRGTRSGGELLAERLASKLGCDCVAREDLTDAATRAGIPVGKLEMAAVRRRPLTEQMAIEKDRYKAFTTATLCERALHNGLVYHGRTGHTVLPGVLNVLRVRVIMDPESRITSVIQRLGLNRQKARRYIDEVDEDRHRWVRVLHNLDWVDPENYDLVINLSHMSPENAAAGMVTMAQLPEFQVTPATQHTLEDLYLGSRCRLALGAHQRTRHMLVTVQAKQGQISVTYLPRDRKEAESIPEVLGEIEGAREILCTMASANLLWIQERFDPQSSSLTQIVDIAGRWNAAVELVQLLEPGGEDARAVAASKPVAGAGGDTTAATPAGAEKNGGILEDKTADEESSEGEGLRQTRARLITAGRAGGFRVVPGGPREVLTSMDRTAPYSLVVIGDVFLSKNEGARKRLTSEMVAYLADHLHIPVIEAGDMATQYLFGPQQWWALLRFGLLSGLILTAVFAHQDEILTFLTREGARNRMLSAVCLFLFVPIFAQMYGGFARHLLRLLKFE